MDKYTTAIQSGVFHYQIIQFMNCHGTYKLNELLYIYVNKGKNNVYLL